MKRRVHADADHAAIEVTVEGNGPDLLLVSGLGGTAAFWQPVAEHMGARFRVIRFDQRGIGASARGSAPCTIGQLAADAADVLRQVGAGPALLVGHSTGGCIVQALAHAAPDLAAGLVLSGSWLRPSRYMTALFQARLALLQAAPRDYAAMSALLAFPPDWLEADWRQFERAVANAPASEAARRVVAERIEALLAFDGSAWSGAITAPRLVIGAADDAVVPAFLQRALAEAMPGCRTHVLPDGGHFFPVTRTGPFVAALEEWWGEAGR
jgi:pimeloyl-ACP methyl ester carboxylesterase